MPKTITMIFLGTHHSTSEQDMLNQLYKAIIPEDGKHIYDGVGARSATGGLDMIPVTEKSRKAEQIAPGKYKGPIVNRAARGAADDMRNTIDKAVNDLALWDSPPDQAWLQVPDPSWMEELDDVNIVGHSRGGVTAREVARYVIGQRGDSATPRVNCLLFDPVNLSAFPDKNVQELPAKEGDTYWEVVIEKEKYRQSLCLKTGEHSWAAEFPKRLYLEVPSEHEGIVNRNKDGNVGEIIAKVFLTHHGTLGLRPPDDKHLFEKLAGYMIDRDKSRPPNEFFRHVLQSAWPQIHEVLYHSSPNRKYLSKANMEGTLGMPSLNAEVWQVHGIDTPYPNTSQWLDMAAS